MGASYFTRRRLLHLSRRARDVRSARAQGRARSSVPQQPRRHVHRRQPRRPASPTRGPYGFGVAWFDLDDDGRLDLFVANDSGPNYVYRNLGGGRFEDVSYPSGAALDAQWPRVRRTWASPSATTTTTAATICTSRTSPNDFNVLYHNDGGAVSPT